MQVRTRILSTIAIVIASTIGLTIPAAASAAPRADLVVATVTAPATVVLGKPATISVTVKNAGRVNSLAGVTRIIASKDALRGRGDIVLGTATTTVVRPGRYA